MTIALFPHQLENLENGRACCNPVKVGEILSRLEKSGNFTLNTGKIMEF